MLSAVAKIAVVDDDESMCQALSRVLRAAGYHVQSYLSAESFLSDPAHERASFVVADVQLRGMSGFDLQRRLQRDGVRVPLAFITAHDELQTREEAKAAGCVAYFRKPFPSRELIEVIHAHTAPARPPLSPGSNQTPTAIDE